MEGILVFSQSKDTKELLIFLVFSTQKRDEEWRRVYLSFYVYKVQATIKGNSIGKIP